MTGSQQSLGEIFKALEGSQFLKLDNKDTATLKFKFK